MELPSAPGPEPGNPIRAYRPAIAARGPRLRAPGLVHCLLLGLLLAGPLAAAPPVLEIGDPSAESYSLQPHMEVFRDRRGELGLGDVQRAHAQGRFAPLPARTGANFGFTTDTVWLRFQAHVRPEGQGTLILELPYAHLDRVVLHAPDAAEGQVTQYAGDRLPMSERRVEYRLPAFDLDLPVGETSTIYLQIHTEGSLQAPAVLWHEVAFHRATSREAYLLGPYYGIMLAMALYNLLVFLSLRDLNYLYYVGAILSIGMFAFTMNGLGYQFIWAEFPAFSSVAMMLFVSLGNFALLQFSRSFLDVRRYVPGAANILLGLQAISGAMIVGAFVMPYRINALILTVVVLASTIIIFCSAILCWLRGERQARYFVLAWTVFLVGGMTYALSTHGLLPSNVLTRNGIQIGSAIEMILLAFALADRMLVLQRENEMIRAEATKRLLRDLHDGMGRHFIKLIRGVENEDIPRVHLRADLRQAFADMRLLVSSTEPYFRDIESGLDMVREQFDGILRDHGIAWNWQVSLDRRGRCRSPQQALNALRIVQEALTNAVKYARASTITVRAYEDRERHIVIEIEDDGTVPWDGSSSGSGHGIRHMHQRARDHDIELDIGGAIPGIRLRVPAV